MGPGPYETARAIGNQFARGFGAADDKNAIEKILSQASSTGNPEDVNKAMSQILSKVSPERQGMAMQVLQYTYNNLEQAKAKRKEQEIEKQKLLAAKEGGYNVYDPEGVKTAKVKAKLERDEFNRVTGQSPIQNQQPTQSMQQPQPQPRGINDQAPQGILKPQGQMQQQEQPAWVKNMTDKQLLENRGHKLLAVREPVKAEMEIRESEKKIAREDAQLARKEQLTFHKETQKFDEELIKQGTIAKKQIEAVDDVEKAIRSGNINPSSAANLFKGLGPVGDKISEALKNKDQAALEATIPQLLEGWKQVFGVRLSDADLRLLQDKLPSIGKSPEANRAVIGVLRKYADMTKLRSEIGAKIKEENAGLRPLGYADLIEKQFDQMSKPVKIVNPKNGRVIEVPAYKVGDAVKSGATLVNE